MGGNGGRRTEQCQTFLSCEHTYLLESRRHRSECVEPAIGQMSQWIGSSQYSNCLGT